MALWRRRAAVFPTVAGAIFLLWWMTALPPADWALWHRYSTRWVLINITLSLLIVAIGYVAMAPAESVRRIARVAAMALGLSIVIAALEVPAVLGYSYSTLLKSAETDTFHVRANDINLPDEDLVYIRRPHARHTGTGEGDLASRLGIPRPARYQFDITFDRHGFRNSRDLDRADVIVLGDSFVEGAESPEPQIATTILARRLGVTVANLGRSGYGPQQELVVLERYGLPLKPRAVVWFLFGGNDLEDARRYESWRQRHGQPPSSLAARSFVGNLLRASSTLSLRAMRVWTSQARPHRVSLPRAGGPDEVSYLDGPERPWAPDGLRLTLEALDRAKAAADAASARFLLVFVPRKFRVYRGLATLEPDSPAHSWPVNDLPGALATWSQAKSAGFLDLTTDLRSATAAGEPVYLAEDTHWNLAGHRVAAEALGRAIHALGIR